MKTKRKFLIAILLIAIGVMIISSTVFAKDVYTPTEFKSQIDTSGTGTGNIKETGGKIVGLIRVVGTITSVGMLAVLGIKYMMGSAEERAEYKKTLFPYIVGAVLIFGASNLTQIIYEWANAL